MDTPSVHVHTSVTHVEPATHMSLFAAQFPAWAMPAHATISKLRP